MTPNTTWIQLKFLIASHQVDALTEALETVGSLAIDLSSANTEEIIEPPPHTMPLWEETIVTGLFTADTDTMSTIAQLSQILPFALPKLTITTLVEENWVQNMQRDFQPMCFGKNLWIYSSWNQPPTHPDATTILLDPGLAFGTGTHATTALCLKWLAENPPSNLNVIDYGCGSGILAVAAAKLGATKVWATDIDQQALQATFNNAENNKVIQKIMITQPDNQPSWQADLIIANIVLRPLTELSTTFVGLLKTGGLVVLSGILESQVGELVSVYQHSFTIMESTIKEGWACIIARKN